ncbi:MAG: hypothetical protein KatS3mg121_1509 [Gammaproteobacteria bacterium]|nr:MAG: hypothetical protein KatS3mg121_1509 [Gammaproteobacteria bacterium]
MAKRPPPQGSPLRILAIAYASGRLDRPTYLRLRREQIAAIEFGKPLPPLPESLRDVTVPQTKIDAPYLARRRHGPAAWLLGGAALLGAAGAVLWWWQAASRPPPPAQQRLPSLDELAERLLADPDWSERDLAAFTRRWAVLTPMAKLQARQSAWYLALENELIKRINIARLRAEQAADPLPHREMLERLLLFQAQLTSD